MTQPKSTNERVARYRAKLKGDGGRQVTAYLNKEVVEMLDELVIATDNSANAIVAGAVMEYSRAINDEIDNARRRFCCYSLEEAEESAFRLGMQWAANEASISHVIFIANFDSIDILDQYASYLPELHELIQMYTSQYITEAYWRQEIKDMLPDYVTSRFYNEKREYIQIAISFFRGVSSIWLKIRDVVDSEIRMETIAYIIPTTGN